MGRKTSGEHPLSAFTIATQPEPEHFCGWSEEELATLDSTVDYANVLLRRILEAGARVKAAYAILHDKDVKQPLNEKLTDYETVPKPSHVHFLAIFNEDEGLTQTQIAKAIGVAHHMVLPPKRGRYAIDGALAYLVHAKEDWKYQYDPAEVITLIGKDYIEVYREKWGEWQHGRAAKTGSVATSALTVEYVIERIIDETMSLEDLLESKDGIRIHSRNKNRINDALNSARLSKMQEAARALEQHEFQKTFVFIDGPAGSGKTTLAVALCRHLEKAFGWKRSVLASRNAMDDYDGSEIMLLNDTRAGAMPAEDWLGLVDANNPLRASARFHNTPVIAPRLIVLTSNQAPAEFFMEARAANATGRAGAPIAKLDAFLRRCDLRLEVHDPNRFGYNNVRMFAPKKVQPFDLELPDGRFEGDQRLTGLTYNLAEYPGHLGNEHDVVYSIYAATEELLRIIDQRNGGLLAASGKNLDEALLSMRESVYDAFMPGGEPLKDMPPLPDPWTGWLHDTLSWSRILEQEEVLANPTSEMSEEAQAQEDQWRQEYADWLEDFRRHAEAGDIPLGWRKGDPRRPAPAEMPLYGLPDDPEAPREDGDPDEPLSYEAFLHYIHPGMHVSFDDDGWFD